ncbi:hypothetical protein CK203_089095 [Vitis vinifera]|uniref:RING-type E3 ubiquitin transferase n=1 Tax=Vitis vinifera TaxID=29760 RepID=A0A438DEK7_VITVI|nr:hypothetical protein CK203_089095 [Vitis vinifera]
MGTKIRSRNGVGLIGENDAVLNTGEDQTAVDIQFEISCTEKKQTILELPYSVKVLVKSIAYRPQEIIMYESDICLPRVLLQNLNLAVSGFFLFKLEPAYHAIEQIIFFNFYAVNCFLLLPLFLDLSSCSRIHNVPLSLQIIEQENGVSIR